MDIIKNIFSKLVDYLTYPAQSDIDLYITSKNPKTPGDVEYWLNRYNLEQRTRSYVY
jgi:hypothetical protein